MHSFLVADAISFGAIRSHKAFATLFFGLLESLLRPKSIHIYTFLLFYQSSAMVLCNCFATKVAYENPLWGEGYHLRAKCWNAMKAMADQQNMAASGTEYLGTNMENL